jgi:hypothetical protein
MNIFNVIKASKTIAEQTRQITEWSEKYSILEKDLKEAQDTIGNFMAEKETFSKQLEDLKAEYEAKLNVASAEVELTKNSLNNEVTKKLASVGIQEGEVKEETVEELTPKSAYAKFISLPQGNERTEFYTKHKALIIKAARA